MEHLAIISHNSFRQGYRNMDTVDTWYPDNLIFGRQSEAKQCISWTDRQTDRRTDRQTDH